LTYPAFQMIRHRIQFSYLHTLLPSYHQWQRVKHAIGNIKLAITMNQAAKSQSENAFIQAIQGLGGCHTIKFSHVSNGSRFDLSNLR